MTTEQKVLVSAAALREVLNALNGSSHLIRELQATRGAMFNNPIDKLIEEFNTAVAQPGVTPQQADETYKILRYLATAATDAEHAELNEIIERVFADDREGRPTAEEFDTVMTAVVAAFVDKCGG